MKTILRLFLAIITVPVTYYFTFWAFALLLTPFKTQQWMRILVNIVPLLCAIFAGWYVWRKKFESVNFGLISYSLIGAVLLGVVGFSAGFFGPIIFTPEANQGPLLGLFITGPLSFVIGGIAGRIYWKTRHQKVQKY
jgi:hypothetical protein